VLSEGALIAHHSTLLRLATETGLTTADAQKVLDTDSYRDAVEDDEAAGRRHHLESVPFFVFGGVDRMTAARSIEDFERTLRRVKT
jgi:predicted DsbA family dithiol-disulfide isomerase